MTRKSKPFRVADWLSLAAAPTFGLMALFAAMADTGAHQMWCSAAVHGSPLTGMVSMYALMSAFHIPPWLKVASGWRRAASPA
jgi:hypothetical protein